MQLQISAMPASSVTPRPAGFDLIDPVPPSRDAAPHSSEANWDGREFSEEQSGRLANGAQDGVTDLAQSSVPAVGDDYHLQIHLKNCIAFKATTFDVSFGALQHGQ